MRMILNVGDWSGDGHSINNKEIFDVNHTVQEVREAYKASCRLTQLSFNHNEDFTDSGRDWRISRDYHICTEYEDSKISDTVYEILEKFIPSEIINSFMEEGHIEDFSGLWWEFVKLSLPDLKVESVGEDLPSINGWNTDGMNVQFGYGLFE